MNSEKVKEIKKALEQNDDNGIMYEVNDQKRTCKFIHHKDILTLINKLESENERLILQYERVKTDSEMNCLELKDRVAELEKGNKDYYDRLNNLQTYIDNHEEIWKVNTKMQLKQFAERLIEKKVKLGERFNIYDINETLKEFINE